MALIWDYDINDLQKNEEGRIKILERMINFGPDKGEKISLTQVKKHWASLQLFRPQKRLLELLIWGKYKSSVVSKRSYFLR